MASPKIYVETPLISDAATFMPLLVRAIRAAPIACLCLRLDPALDERTLINAVKLLAPPAQEAETAVLVDASPIVAIRGGADGCHVDGLAPARAAIEALRPERIVGIGSVHSKHDAMEAGELEPDYVLFGALKRDGGTGAMVRPALGTLIDRAAWWSQMFRIPCVALAADPAAIEPLSQTGADFIGLGAWLFENDFAFEAELLRVHTHLKGIRLPE